MAMFSGLQKCVEAAEPGGQGHCPHLQGAHVSWGKTLPEQAAGGTVGSSVASGLWQPGPGRKMQLSAEAAGRKPRFPNHLLPWVTGDNRVSIFQVKH